MLDAVQWIMGAAGWLGFSAIGFVGVIVAAHLFGWGMVWRIALFRLPVPAVFFVAIFIFTTADKSSAIRVAVNEAVTELVAGEELAAAEARAEAKDMILAAMQRQRDRAEARAELLEEANRRFAQKQREAGNIAEEMQDEIDALQDDPDRKRCGVSDDVFGGLRSNQPTTLE